MFEEAMQQMRVVFRQEALDLFDELDEALLALEAEPRNTDAINRVFRAMHTIKGSGATAGFEQMSRFAHRVEDVFNQAREGRVLVTAELVDSALRACDTLKLMLEAGAQEAAALEDGAAQIVAALVAASGGAAAVAPVSSAAAPQSPAAAAGTTAYRIVFRPKRELFYSGTDPVLLLDELRQLGDLQLTAHFDDVPPLEEMDPELCYTWWSAVFTTSRPLSQVQNIFEFVQDDCHIEIEAIPPAPVGGDAAAGAKADAFAATAWQCLEAIESCVALVAAGDREVATWRSYLRSARTFKSACEYAGKGELAQSLVRQVALLEKVVQDDGECSGHDLESLVDEQRKVRDALDRRQDKVMPAPIDAEPAADKSPAAQVSAPQTIRVDQSKLDRLMRAVGELLVARGAFPTISRKLNNDHQLNGMAKEVRDAGNNIARIADELQTTAMAMRMLPIKTTLQRFPRLIRDMSRSLNKSINFAVEGEDTELDKTVIERISDPLVHLVRNSADHGIELAPERAARGKPPEGTIRVRAFNEGSRVVLQVSDDGKGLDPAFLRRKAVDKGLLTAEAAGVLTDEQAYDLIFVPGFSTADKVTDVSGRGVGMDVVRSNVRSLNGTIDIASQIGKGTQFTIRLPTSLMVSKGILFRAGGEDYIVPMDSLIDMTKVPRAAIRNHQGQRLAHVRGQVYSLVTMADLLASGGPAADRPGADPAEEPQEYPIAIVQSGHLAYGIVVDRFIDEVEVMVKPMAGGLGDLSLFSGATIMGDGRIVLVINPAELPRYAKCTA